MSLSDPIADMLTRIRNASSANHDTVDIPHSKLKEEIARILKKEGFVKDFATEGQGGKKTMRMYLRYDRDQQPIIKGIVRDSKPGLRHYVNSGDIPRVLGGLGVAVLSTSSGVLTDREARKAKVGGEVLCRVW